MSTPEHRREVFQRVKAHLLAQGKRSMKRFNEESPEGFSCLYRGPEGLKCAVGVLISDEAYSPMLEEQLPSHLEVSNALEASGIQMDSHMEDLLLALQAIHDSARPSHWEENLNIIEEILESRDGLRSFWVRTGDPDPDPMTDEGIVA
jgi:hypothetical protein